MFTRDRFPHLLSLVSSRYLILVLRSLSCKPHTSHLTPHTSHLTPHTLSSSYNNTTTSFYTLLQPFVLALPFLTLRLLAAGSSPRVYPLP
jgi:hypothetical protein